MISVTAAPPGFNFPTFGVDAGLILLVRFSPFRCVEKVERFIPKQSDAPSYQ